MYDTKLSSSKESAQPDIPSKEALISPFEVVVEDAASEEVIPAQYTTQDLAETDVVVDAGRIYDQQDWEFSLQEGLIIAGSYAYKFFLFWVALALLVSADSDHDWVENFKMVLLIVAIVISFVVISGINNFMSKKYVFYKLHGLLLQFEHRPAMKLLGLFSVPPWFPVQYTDVASILLVFLMFGTLVFGLAVFYYDDTKGARQVIQDRGLSSIKFAKLGGAIGAALSAVSILVQYTSMVRVYNILIPFNVVMDDDTQDFHKAPIKKAWIQHVTCVKEADFRRFASYILYNRAYKRSPAEITVDRFRDYADQLRQDPTVTGCEVPAPSNWLTWLYHTRDHHWFLYESFCSDVSGDDVALQGLGSRVIKSILCCCGLGERFIFQKTSSIWLASFLVLVLLGVASGYGMLENVSANSKVVCPTGYTCSPIASPSPSD